MICACSRDYIYITSKGCHGLPSSAIYCHRLPKSAIVCHGLPKPATSCHRLPIPADHASATPRPAITELAPMPSTQSMATSDHLWTDLSLACIMDAVTVQLLAQQ